MNANRAPARTTEEYAKSPLGEYDAVDPDLVQFDDLPVPNSVPVQNNGTPFCRCPYDR